MSIQIFSVEPHINAGPYSYVFFPLRTPLRSSECLSTPKNPWRTIANLCFLSVNIVLCLICKVLWTRMVKSGDWVEVSLSLTEVRKQKDLIVFLVLIHFNFGLNDIRARFFHERCENRFSSEFPSCLKYPKCLRIKKKREKEKCPYWPILKVLVQWYPTICN